MEVMISPAPLTWEAFQIFIVCVGFHGFFLISVASGTDLFGVVALAVGDLSSGAYRYLSSAVLSVIRINVNIYSVNVAALRKILVIVAPTHQRQQLTQID
jgi:hypothetical protein